MLRGLNKFKEIFPKQYFQTWYSSAAQCKTALCSFAGISYKKATQFLSCKTFSVGIGMFHCLLGFKKT